MLYLESPRTDPYFNLALEQYLFDTVGQTQALFMLWQNANTIVVGKHQNACQEVNADFVREQGIRVVRRLSGGGAVYHDLGNLNFTFIAAAEDAALDLRLFCQPVARGPWGSWAWRRRSPAATTSRWTGGNSPATPSTGRTGG